MVAREFPEALFARLPLGVVIVDESGRVTRISRVACQTLGCGDPSWIGRSVDDLFGGSNELSGILARLSDGDERRMTLTVARESGPDLELGLTAVALGAGIAAPTFALILGDLGRLRQVELDLQRFEVLGSSLRITSGLAHVLRNPLAAILGFAELLYLELPRDSVHSGDAERILAMVGRIDLLITSCMRLAPIGARRTDLDPLEVVAGAVEASAAKTPAGLAPVVSVRDAPPSIYVDRSQAIEALGALIENAVEAAGESCPVEIEISTEPENGTRRTLVRFAVRDRGPGMAGSDPTRLFDPFFTTKPGRIGLGLSVAQALAVQNRGFIDVDLKPGVTSFGLLLPASAGAAALADPGMEGGRE
ncbi:MAG TPA: ATP-binding protein [Thermoanaerobaculia bacterium]|nr:ATP-binding protein [Thermoanaerobaculia bacterium]